MSDDAFFFRNPLDGDVMYAEQPIGEPCSEWPANPVAEAGVSADPAGAVLERQNRRESNARTYPRRIPLVLKSAQGVHVTDADGRVFIDCLAGAGALALGHNHPVVVAAVRQALESGVPWQTLDLMTPLKDRFVEDLFDSLPAAFAADARIQFCGPSGADAIEAALKLVKTATGRRGIFYFHGAYHGMTHGALSLTGEVAPKEAIAGLMAEAHPLPYPYTYRCPFGLLGEVCHETSSRYLEHLLDDPHSGLPRPAALILEAVQGEGGVIPAPLAWLREIRRITAERGICLIIDEVQTGLGRTGSLYAFEQAGILPDVLVLSKAIGGGLPVSVVVYRSELDVWKPGAHAGTFRGNQLALAAGSATIRQVREHGLAAHAADVGAQLMAGLTALKARHPQIGDVRGRGLMVGMEIVDPDGAKGAGVAPPCWPEMARRIQQEALRQGLIIELGGRHDCVLRFLPPLIIDRATIDEIVGIIGEAVRVAETDVPPRGAAGAGGSS